MRKGPLFKILESYSTSALSDSQQALLKLRIVLMVTSNACAPPIRNKLQIILASLKTHQGDCTSPISHVKSRFLKLSHPQGVFSAAEMLSDPLLVCLFLHVFSVVTCRASPLIIWIG